MTKDLFGILVIECECDESCDIGEYLDYKNFKCKNKLVDKLVAECTENIDEVKIAEITSTELHSAGHENEYLCFYTICVILPYQSALELVLIFLILVGT